MAFPPLRKPTITCACHLLRSKELVAALVSLVVAGCTLHPTNPAPRPGPELAEFSADAKTETIAPVGPAWWLSMQSPQLTGYIEKALRTSRSVEAARARFAQADAIYRRASAALGPNVDFKARYDHDIKADVPRDDYWEIGPALSWEIDVFGRAKSTQQVRRMERDSRGYLLQGAQLTLSANVAEAYLGVIEQNELLRLLHSQRDSSLNFLRIIQQRYDQGLISVVDLLQQRSQVLDTESLIPDAEANLRVQENILQTLVGDWPEGRGMAVEGTLPLVAPLPSLGNPGDLLAHRPDLLVARADLMASDADIGRAIADRLPRLTFSADALLVEGRGKENLLSTLSSGLVLPLLDWGSRRMEVVRSKEVYRERLAIFAQTYQDAVLDVENAVVRAVKQRELNGRLEERRKLLEEVLQQSQERYTRGLTDYLPVLTSLQQLNAVEQRLIRERRKLLSQRVTLHRALGGPVPPQEGGVEKK